MISRNEKIKCFICFVFLFCAMTKVEEFKTCSLWTAFDKMQLCFTLAPQVLKFHKVEELLSLRRMEIVPKSD